MSPIVNQGASGVLPFAYVSIANPTTAGTDQLMPLQRVGPNFGAGVGSDPVNSCATGFPVTVPALGTVLAQCQIPLAFFRANPAMNVYFEFDVGNAAGTQKCAVALSANVPFKLAAGGLIAIPNFSGAVWSSYEQIGADLAQITPTSATGEITVQSTAGGQLLAQLYTQINLP